MQKLLIHVYTVMASLKELRRLKMTIPIEHNGNRCSVTKVVEVEQRPVATFTGKAISINLTQATETYKTRNETPCRYVKHGHD